MTNPRDVKYHSNHFWNAKQAVARAIVPQTWSKLAVRHFRTMIRPTCLPATRKMTPQTMAAKDAPTPVR